MHTTDCDKRVMIKRAQGRKRFGRKNFKQRYFRLTTLDLSYSKTKGKEPLCKIPLEEILAVERLQEDSFKMKNMFQIIQSQRALYVQAGNCVEEKEWIDILTKICRTNSNRLEKYHPSAYINGHWLCCKAVAEVAPGCSGVSLGIEAGLRLVLDPDRDLQRIHSLIFTNMPRLETLMSACECQAVYGASDMCVIPGGGSPIEDVPSCFKTLTALKEAAYALQHEHRAYFRRLARDTKYGSKQAPIGDDNYLHLAARAGFENLLTKRVYDADTLNQHYIETDHCYDSGFSRHIEDQRYNETFRNCLDPDSIHRRYENENNLLRRYENNTDTIRSIQNDLKKFDYTLNNTLRADKTEKKANLENNRRLGSCSLLASDGIHMSGTLSRKFSNYDHTKILSDCTVTRLRDNTYDISCNSVSEHAN